MVWNGDTWKPVKNLGWLLRNWREVDSFETIMRKDPNDPMSTTLVAYMRDNVTVYCSSKWRGYHTLANWLNRPVFEGVPIRWFGRMATVDDDLINK